MGITWAQPRVNCVNSAKPMRLTITSDQYDDMLALDGSQFNATLLSVAREIIQRGGCVVVQTEYVNASPDIRRVFRTVRDLDEWQAEITRVSELAKRAGA